MKKDIDTVKQQNNAIQNITAQKDGSKFFCLGKGKQVKGWCFLMFKLNTFQRSPMKLKIE